MSQICNVGLPIRHQDVSKEYVTVLYREMERKHVLLETGAVYQELFSVEALERVSVGSLYAMEEKTVLMDQMKTANPINVPTSHLDVGILVNAYLKLIDAMVSKTAD